LVEVIPYSDSHRASVLNIILSIQREEFEIPVSLADQPDLLDIAGFYRKGNGNFWVALVDAQVVGTISLLDIGNDQGALRKMFVAAPFRGSTHGVALHLLETLLNWCRLKDTREIYLGTTSKFLAAHRFYEKNGFTEIEQIHLPAAFPIMAVDTKFYQRRL